MYFLIVPCFCFVLSSAASHQSLCRDGRRANPSSLRRLPCFFCFDLALLSHPLPVFCLLFSGFFTRRTSLCHRLPQRRRPIISQGPLFWPAPGSASSLLCSSSCRSFVPNLLSCLGPTVSWRFAHGFGSQNAPLPAFRWQRSEHDLE